MENTWVRFDEFTTAYLEAALFTSNDEADDSGGNPLNLHYSTEDIEAGSLARMMEDCQKFQAAPAWKAALEAEACTRRAGYSQEGMGGHDFWLTRNGHGAGFWDGDWKDPHSRYLTNLANDFGEVGLTVGDDGKVHQA